MITKEQIQNEIENQEKTGSRNGDNVAKCEACNKIIDLNIERVYYFSGNICEKCYRDVENH